MGCSCASERLQEEEPVTNDIYIEVINEHLQEHPLLLYTTSSSEDSKVLKDLLRQENVDFEYFDLDKLREGEKISHTLKKLTFYKAPPFVFYNKSFIGGVVECKKLLKIITTQN
jgi:glutaredoxin